MLRDRIAHLDGAVTQYFTGHTCGLYCEVKGWRGNRAFSAASTAKAREVRQRGAAPFTSNLDPAEIGGLASLLDAFERMRDTGHSDGIEE